MSQIQQRFAITGMTCQACASRLEKVLNKKTNVQQAQVNFATETLDIIYHDAGVDEVRAWIAKAGFDGVLMTDDTKTAKPLADNVPWRLFGVWLISLPFWVGMIGMMAGSHALMPPVWLQFVLASVVQFYFAVPFYRGAWASLRGGLANMDVLVALGTSVIWAYSTYGWYAGGASMVYFEASVMIVAFILLGKYLEMRTKKHSLDSLSLLMELVPQSVQKKQGESWQEVPSHQIVKGDVLLAKTGDKIACDGVVLSGLGLTDEAHLTGESLALCKSVGETVLAGSVVLEGGFEYRAVATGEQTALGDMMRALQEAQGTKANIARLADKVAGVFVPSVVMLAVLTFFGNAWLLGDMNESLVRAVAVLVIACPCALGLATPTAIMAGMGLASRHGVRFKDAVSLEMMGQINTFVFDKTGTLTLGVPKIDKVWLFDDKGGKFNERFLVALAASVEQYSNHPLAKALMAYAKECDVALMNANCAKTIIAQGMTATVAGHDVMVGSPSFVGVEESVLARLDDDWHSLSLVAVAVDGVACGLFGVSDTIAPNAKDSILAWRQQGIDSVMLSGDHEKAVANVAKKVGISLAKAMLSPRDKTLIIKELQDSGQKVAMIGDGVNDAPAMAQADVSVAVNLATGIAKQTASVQIFGDVMSHVDKAYRIGRMTLKVIYQNLFFAFIYNIVGIGMAMAGLLNPIVAAFLMAMSSLSVLFNALRLKWQRF